MVIFLNKTNKKYYVTPKKGGQKVKIYQKSTVNSKKKKNRKPN